MSLDSYVTLGQSGLRVSPLCLGAMTFGEDWGWGSSVAESEAILAAYLERGGNFIDTANVYTNGHSEKIIGDFYAQKKGSRQRAVIATKFFANMHIGDPNGGGAGRKAIVAQCEDSLRRLQTDYIDLYWLHNWDQLTPIEETMRALDDLVRDGKVRYLGVSDVPAWKAAQAQTMAQFRGWTPFIAMQLEYSLLARTVEGELTPMSQAMGMGVMPWSPLKGGWLSGKYTRENSGTSPSTRTAHLKGPSEKDHLVIDALKAIAAELSTTPAAVALAWVQGRPGVASTIIGARTMGQLTDNLAALDVSLGEAQVAKLDELSRPALNFPADNNRDVAPMLASGGTTINGKRTRVWPLLTRGEARY